MSLLISGSLLLAVLVGSAAVAKILSFLPFVSYLNVLFRNYARSIAILVISFEAVLSVSLIMAVLMHRGLPLLLPMVGIFFLAATVVVAYRLVLYHDTKCGCWGTNYKRLPQSDGIIASILRPLWYGLRNGLLLVGTGALFDLSQNEYISLSTLGATLIFAVCPLVIATGMIVSVVVQRRWLKLEEHPLKRELAPRLAPLVALSWYTDNQKPDSGWIMSLDIPDH
jgi:hypothetical protein